MKCEKTSIAPMFQIEHIFHVIYDKHQIDYPVRFRQMDRDLLTLQQSIQKLHPRHQHAQLSAELRVQRSS